MGVVDSPPAVVWRGGPAELAVGRAHVVVDGTNVGIICCINVMEFVTELMLSSSLRAAAAS